MKKLKLTALASAMLVSVSANAAIVTENFSVSVLDGEFIGTTGSGFFSYDNSLITGFGNETIDANSGLALELTVFGQTFTEANDIDYSGYPALTFLDGAISSLDYYVSESMCFDCIDQNITDIIKDGVYDFSIYPLTKLADGSFEAVLSVNGSINPVPVPAAVWLFGSGLIGLAGVARRKKS